MSDLRTILKKRRLFWGKLPFRQFAAGRREILWSIGLQFAVLPACPGMG
jgi:hypothetical protein